MLILYTRTLYHLDNIALQKCVPHGLIFGLIQCIQLFRAAL